jgi:hypothetical protein
LPDERQTEIAMLFHRRHLIALMALVGWYLMIPPFHISGNVVRAELNAPMSKWSQVRAFDRASDCEAARSAEQRKPTGNLVIMMGAKQAQAVANAAVCIASDDGRFDLQ